MLRSYLKIALRNLHRNRVFSLINIAGLGLGIAAFGLILEYVAFEKSVNTFHQNLSSLYRLTSQNHEGEFYTNMAPAVAPLAKQTFPEVRDFCRIAENSANGIVTIANGKDNASVKPLPEDRLAYADAAFFTLFTFPLVQGTAATAIAQPNTVALSQSQARKYFGKSNALGRSLTLNNQFGKTLYTVTAVYADMPQNSDLRFDAVFALQTLANPANLNGNTWARLDGFDGSYLTTFFQLPDGTDPQVLESKFNAFVKQRNPQDDTRFWLQPAANMHLAASLSDSYSTFGSLGFVYLLSGIALLILLIAWFNYINLSTAATLKRAKEVGVRKVVGANPAQLIGQFLGESILLNLIGFGVAITLILTLQNGFNTFVEKDLSLAKLLQNPFWLAGLSLLIIGALASGGYVAFATTSFQPVDILKSSGKIFRVGRGNWLRKTLVVVQFSASVALVIVTLVLYRQLQYMQNKDLGVRLDQRVVIEGPRVGDEKAHDRQTTVLEHQITQLPYVRSYSETSIVPGNYYSFGADGITKQNPPPDAEKKNYSMGIIDHRYLQTFGIGLVAGRNFTPLEAEAGWEKSAKLMVNETAARQLGFSSPAEAVRQIITWGQPYEIVGVVKDYHHQGLREAISPLIFMPRRGLPGNFAVQLTTDNIQRKIAQLERLYKAAYPGNPFEFYFVDERYNRQYKTEQQYGQVFSGASALAIFIACLGLFGLATFMTEQRTKEIGVRKVLGASVVGIVTLLSKEFLKPVFVSIVIASPLTWYAMDRWLQNFAYKVDIEWWMFALAGLLAVCIALLTVSFQSIKSALANPVKSLRSE